MNTLARRTVLSARSSRFALAQRTYASGHGPHYNEPSGYLFGEKPLAPGEKRKTQGWETIWYFGMFGSMALAAVGLYFKPDTSISTWAMQEAKQRMEARGEPTSYRPSSS